MSFGQTRHNWSFLSTSHIYTKYEKFKEKILLIRSCFAACGTRSLESARYNEISRLTGHFWEKYAALKVWSQSQIMGPLNRIMTQNITKNTQKWQRTNHWTSLKWPSVVWSKSYKTFVDGAERCKKKFPLQTWDSWSRLPVNRWRSLTVTWIVSCSDWEKKVVQQNIM